MTGVALATGAIDRVENLLDRPESVVVTCPERSPACAYRHGPDRADDLGAASWLSLPFCSRCGCSLVVVPAAEYDGPTHGFRDDLPGASP